MGFDHRKLLVPFPNLNDTKPACMLCCTSDDHYDSSDCLAENCKCFPPPAPLPAPSSHGGGDSTRKQLVAVGLIVMACIILLGILCTVVKVFYLRRNNPRRRYPPIIFGTEEDFLDEDRRPALDRFIWYINTVGLPQSVIDSIALFKYNKGEGLIEGTECSVCLSEFQEDESLRLLPKCSHAFHVTCIDTWLRSHKNCPLCRAPIITGAVVAQAQEAESSSGGLDSRNEIEITVVNSENFSEERSNTVGEGGVSEIINGNDNNGSNYALSVEDVQTDENSRKNFPCLKTRNCDSDSRVLRDLAENRGADEEDTQPMRSLVSLDSSAASVIYNAVTGGVMHNEHQGNVGTQIGNPGI